MILRAQYLLFGLCLLLCLLGLAARRAAAITPGHVDDFQDGTVQGWTGGSAPTNQPTGGPGGASDRYLQISAINNFLGTFNNNVQWSGNYIAAAIDHLNIHLNNFGPNPVSIRIMLATPGCSGGAGLCTAWTSTNATNLAAGSGWVLATFSVKEANLTRVLGSNSYTASLQNVERLLIRHDDGTPSPPGTGPIVTATLGIDNVVPEPGETLGLVAGAALLACVRRKRREPRI